MNILLSTEIYACENESLSIECDDDDYIQIEFANYGRLDNSICDHRTVSDWKDPCMASRSLATVQAMCDGNQQCEIKASNRVFGDPCGGIFKYLEVRYSCQQGF